MNRREFLKVAGAGAAAFWLTKLPDIAEPLPEDQIITITDRSFSQGYLWYDDISVGRWNANIGNRKAAFYMYMSPGLIDEFEKGNLDHIAMNKFKQLLDKRQTI